MRISDWSSDVCSSDLTIHDLYLRRQLITLGEDMVNDAFDYDLDVEATQQIEVAEDRLYKLAEIGQTEGGLSPFRMAVLESLHLTEAAMKQDGLSGVSTGQGRKSGGEGKRGSVRVDLGG